MILWSYFKWLWITTPKTLEINQKLNLLNRKKKQKECSISGNEPKIERIEKLSKQRTVETKEKRSIP